MKGRGAVRVVIVDDQVVFSEALRALMDQHEQIDVVGTAESGPEALKLAVRLDADVVVMDVGLPGMDGLEATRELRRRRPSARIVLLTGRTEREAAEAARDAGADAFLVKGALGDELVETVLAVAT
jgi:DNA-binding NarL/FixJ family response regulator